MLQQPKRLGLLAYLAVASPRRFHRRDSLLALFWPELDQEHARAALRRALYFLRTELGPEVVAGRGDEEVGVPETEVWCDATALDQALAAGDPAGGARALPRRPARRPLRGRRLHRFPGLARPRAAAGCATARPRPPPPSRPRAEREGRHADAVAAARRGVELAADDEAALRRYLELLDRAGEHSAALRAYDDFARRLAHELELEPDDGDPRAGGGDAGPRRAPEGGHRAGGRGGGDDRRAAVRRPGRPAARLPGRGHGRAARHQARRRGRDPHRGPARAAARARGRPCRWRGRRRRRDRPAVRRRPIPLGQHRRGRRTAPGLGLALRARRHRRRDREAAAAGEGELFELVDELARSSSPRRAWHPARGSPGSRRSPPTRSTRSRPTCGRGRAARRPLLRRDGGLPGGGGRRPVVRAGLLPPRRGGRGLRPARPRPRDGRPRRRAPGAALAPRPAGVRRPARVAPRRGGPRRSRSTTPSPAPTPTTSRRGSTWATCCSTPIRSAAARRRRRASRSSGCCGSSRTTSARWSTWPASPPSRGGREEMLRPDRADPPRQPRRRPGAGDARPPRLRPRGTRRRSRAVTAELQQARAITVAIAFADVALYSGNLAGAAERWRGGSSRWRARPSCARCATCMLAHLALAAGDLDGMRAELREAGGARPRPGGSRCAALFATLPFVPASEAELREVRDALERWDPADAGRRARS